MPDPQQPDYDALAKQAGGVDYDALAAKAQAGEQKPPSVDESVWDRMKVSGWTPMVDAYRTMGGAVVNNLPAIGAGIGALAGEGVGSIPLAGLGGAIGRGAQNLIRGAQGEAIPSTATDVAKDLGSEGATQGAIQGIGLGAGKALSAGAKYLGPRLMQSALKVPGDVGAAAAKKGIIPPVVQTMLDEGINVTSGGLAKLQRLIGETQGKVTAAVGNLTGQIERPVVAMRAASPARKMIAGQTNPAADLKALAGEVDEFLHPVVGPKSLTPQEAQAMKVGTYKQIGDKYGTPAALLPGQIQAQMAFARGLKEEIEHLATAQGQGDVKALNAREGRLLEALQDTAKRVALARNANPAGFAFVAHAPASFMAALIDRSPGVKSMLARGLYTSASHMTGVSPQLLRAMVAAVASEPESQ